MYNISVGLIGCGNVGKEHLNVYLKSKVVKKIHIYDPLIDYNSDKKFSSKKIILYKNKEKFFSQSFKIASICNYDADHAELIKLFIKKNTHVFAEKPISTNLNDLKQINFLLNKKKHKSMLGSNLILRESSLFKQIKKRIKRGDFGKIFYFEGDYLYGRLNKILNGWRGKEVDYSVITGGAIHLIDLMIYLLGSFPTTVKSYQNKIVTANKSFKPSDFNLLIYKFKNKALGKISSNYGCVHNHQHVVKVFGTKKTFIYDDQGYRIFNKRDFHKVKNTGVRKLYSNKGLHLLNNLSLLKNKQKSFKKINLNEIKVMLATLEAKKSLSKNKEIKIKY